MQLTEGTLRPVPEIYMPDGHGHVAVLTQISATRPDGRNFNDTQILLFTLDEGRVRLVDQFVGDPPAVTFFWA
jgi:ketosteroid isomerase-like protein